MFKKLKYNILCIFYKYNLFIKKFIKLSKLYIINYFNIK